MPVTRELLEAAVALRGSSPELWERFTMAVRVYSAQTTAEMTRCDPALLLRAQGMAIAMADLSASLSNAHEMLERARK